MQYYQRGGWGCCPSAVPALKVPGEYPGGQGQTEIEAIKVAHY